MKKNPFTIIIVMIAVLFPLISTAQTDDRKGPPTEKEREDKVDKLKIAFITTELNLTSDEATKFWPIYNELEIKLKELRKANRKLTKEAEESYEKMTSEEAKKKLAAIFENEEKEIALKKEYGEKFSKLLGDKRALKLLSLEHEFKRELLEVLREQGPPPPPPHQGPNGRRP